MKKQSSDNKVSRAIRKASREIHAGVGGRAGAHSTKKGKAGYSRKAKHAKRGDQ